MSAADRQRRASRLLARGGKILVLAAVAHSRGQRSGQGPWHALPAETVAAVEEILLALENEGEDDELLEAVLRAALSQAPATAAPSWAEPLWRDPRSLSRVGERIDAAAVTRLLSGETDPPPRLRGN